MYGTGEALEGAPLDQAKVREHMREQRGGGGVEYDDRKRGYNSLKGATTETTAEDEIVGRLGARPVTYAHDHSLRSELLT